MFFDPTTVDREGKSISLLPNGVYLVKVDKANVKQKDASTLGLSVFMNVVAPRQFLDQSLFEHFNLRNQSPKAEEIGKREFARFLDAVHMGDKPLENETLIEDKFLKVTVGQEPDNRDMTKMRNKLLKFEQLDARDKEAVREILQVDPDDYLSDIPAF